VADVLVIAHQFDIAVEIRRKRRAQDQAGRFEDGFRRH
jgi:hypothetical protein